MKNPLDSLKFWKRSDPAGPGPVAAKKPASAAPLHPVFPTSVLKNFIASVTRKNNPVVLDIGPVIGSNIEFFFNLGIKIYMEDFLAAYANPAYTQLVDGKVVLDETKFFAENFDYADQFFDGLICWDFLSYLDPRFAKTFVQRITAKMKPESLVLGFFQTQKSQGPVPVRKYKISSESQLEHIPQQVSMEVRKVYQTRDATQLFSGYHSERFYLLKHNVIEVLLRKDAPQKPADVF